VQIRPTAYPHRHSSLRGDASTDPRPIKDKAFVNKNIRVLLNFLTDHNYDFPISPRILSRPAVRDFANIIQFLFRKIDPNFNSAGKFEDEVIQMFKALGYPFNISKTALVAVGSPHTWPTLLAAVMWVTELLTVDEELTDAEERAEVLSDDVNLNQKVFFGYLSRAYKHFMSGEDDRYAALEEQFAASFESKIQELTIELNEVLERNEELRKQTVDAQGRRSRLPQLRQERTDLEIELEKLQVLIEQLKVRWMVFYLDWCNASEYRTRRNSF
jgi:kinetochore protein NDC80